MKRITIDPVSRIEGHARVTILVDDAGNVASTQFQVTQVRGFEKFTEGRPFYEMPGITSRICGICPISHQLASAKACDEIIAVRLPSGARKLRELIHCAQFVQSHALSFFYLSSPDLLLGMDADPALRNVVGVIEAHPELARDGIELRKFGLQVIESLAQERVHASWIVPGGVGSPMSAQVRDRILGDLPGVMAIAERTLSLFKGAIDGFKDEIDYFGSAPTMHAGLTDSTGNAQLYDGTIRFRDENGKIVQDQIPSERYADFIGEATVRDSYLKAPFYKPVGYPAGIYRVGSLARVNVIDAFGTPRADGELNEFRERFGRMPHSSFLYHYARLLEILYALERMKILLTDPDILSTHVRANASVNALEGIGIIEAPRGLLIHHYKVNEDGAIQWANLIVATGHNNLAISRSVQQVSEHFIKGDHIEEGAVNRVAAVIRAYDPCLSCSTHADGTPAVRIELVDPQGRILDEAGS